MMRSTHKVQDMADYLRPNQIVNTEAKFVFMLRSRMMDVRMNYYGQHADTLCPLCDSERDTQEHLLVCTELATSNSVVLLVKHLSIKNCLEKYWSRISPYPGKN